MQRKAYTASKNKLPRSLALSGNKQGVYCRLAVEGQLVQNSKTLHLNNFLVIFFKRQLFLIYFFWCNIRDLTALHMAVNLGSPDLDILKNEYGKQTPPLPNTRLLLKMDSFLI